MRGIGIREELASGHREVAWLARAVVGASGDSAPERDSVLERGSIGK